MGEPGRRAETDKEREPTISLVGSRADSTHCAARRADSWAQFSGVLLYAHAHGLAAETHHVRVATHIPEGTYT